MRRRGVLAGVGVGLCTAWVPRRADAEWLRDEVVVYADPALRPVLAAISQRMSVQLRVFCAPPRQMLGLLAHGTQDDVLISQVSVVAAARQAGLAAAGSVRLWRNHLAFAVAGSGSPGVFDAAALAAAVGGGKLAVPDPIPSATVDGAGVLERLGLTDALAGRVQGAASTADALGMLATGDATMALCHVSEINGRDAHMAMPVPAHAYDPIEYLAALSAKAWSRNQNAVLAGLPRAPEARAFGMEALA